MQKAGGLCRVLRMEVPKGNPVVHDMLPFLHGDPFMPARLLCPTRAHHAGTD